MKRYDIAYCFFPKAKSPTVPDAAAQPEKTADPQQIGQARQAEDQTLFGGIPDLRVDRSTTGGGVGAGGSGLNVPSGQMTGPSN
ncbi:MAG: hypothetical protein EOR11_19965 [Mesorhizobium sp.]|uniref:hypothetical protein n=1 Tax=Mesorhizobium sp. TaxID=1871066 RepID=UPI000FE73D06|nr:hypothetical protein [Mesorhizobium sp.]RWP84739.1 MAG: hypothetical protein EOR11_19965 [Mesorhizobium sp.]